MKIAAIILALLGCVVLFKARFFVHMSFGEFLACAVGVTALFLYVFKGK